METSNAQQQFFQEIKGKLAPHLSIVDEVAELLNISNDSAYRRIRGEKVISFDELHLLCSKYNVSLDQFLHLQSDNYVFSGKLKNDGENSFNDWLNSVQEKFQLFNSFENRHMFYLFKDIPPFVHFQVRELAAFKFFFWTKSILHDESMKGVKFYIDDPRYDAYFPASNKIIELFNKIPITEIWNIESLNSSLRQIEFYAESGSFKNPSEIRFLYSRLLDLINHIEKQAELGVKFNFGEEPKSDAEQYRMFVNELVLGDNTIMVKLNDKPVTFLNHSVLYFVATQDERFNTAMEKNLENLMKRSTMISVVGDKERTRFFNRLRDMINQKLLVL